MSYAQSTSASAVQIFGVVLNTIMYMSPVLVYRNLIRSGNSKGFSLLPPYGLYLTSGTWICYAFSVLPTPQMIAINSFGTVLSLFYIGIIFYFTKADEIWAGRFTRRFFISALTIGYVFLLLALYGGLFGSIQNETDRSRAKSVVSSFTIIVNTGLWLGPLLALRRAYVLLDTFAVSIPLSFLQLGVGCTWTAAGILLDDNTVIITSAVGIVLSGLQILVLVVIICERRRRLRLGIPLPASEHKKNAQQDPDTVGKKPDVVLAVSSSPPAVSSSPPGAA